MMVHRCSLRPGYVVRVPLEPSTPCNWDLDDDGPVVPGPLHVAQEALDAALQRAYAAGRYDMAHTIERAHATDVGGGFNMLAFRDRTSALEWASALVPDATVVYEERGVWIALVTTVPAMRHAPEPEPEIDCRLFEAIDGPEEVIS